MEQRSSASPVSLCFTSCWQHEGNSPFHLPLMFWLLFLGFWMSSWATCFFLARDVCIPVLVGVLLYVLWVLMVRSVEDDSGEPASNGMCPVRFGFCTAGPQ